MTITSNTVNVFQSWAFGFFLLTLVSLFPVKMLRKKKPDYKGVWFYFNYASFLLFIIFFVINLVALLAKTFMR